MRQMLKHVGTGLCVVVAMAGVAAVTVARVDARDQADESLLMKFEEFGPLHAKGGVLVVDVRALSSFAAGHIPGAMHMPAPEVPRRVAAVKRAAKGRLVVTYCSCPSEATSLIAARMLTEAGVEAKALVGGFPRWVESGGAIERRSGKWRSGEVGKWESWACPPKLPRSEGGR